MTESTINCPGCGAEIRMLRSLEYHSDAEQKRVAKLYEDTRADLLKRQLSNSENADRAILSVSTASLGFSLAFLKDTVPLPEAYCEFWLYLSWVFFILAILATLSSFFTGQKAIDEQLNLAYRYYVQRDDSAGSIKPKQAVLTDRLNKLGAIFLVFGLVMASAFVAINFLKGNTMTNKVQFNDGALIPMMQPIQKAEGNSKEVRGKPSTQVVQTNPEGVERVQHPPRTPVTTATVQNEGSKGK